MAAAPFFRPSAQAPNHPCRSARPLARLVLASSSPRRRALLESLGLDFDVMAAAIDEEAKGTAAQVAREVAMRKARAVAMRVQDATVLAADTVGEIDGRLLGKPADAEDARRTLKSLSGRTHLVVTAVVATSVQGGKVMRTIEGESKTKVTFHRLEDATIDAYVATGEPLDKAAAYGIQGAAGAFVLRIEGSWTNVVGLPVDVALRALAAVDHPLPPHLRLHPLRPGFD